jgi:hypothetical protein
MATFCKPFGAYANMTDKWWREGRKQLYDIYTYEHGGGELLVQCDYIIHHDKCTAGWHTSHTVTESELIGCNNLKSEYYVSSCLTVGGEEMTRRSRGKAAHHLYTTENKNQTQDDLDQNCGRGITKHQKSNRPKSLSAI